MEYESPEIIATYVEDELIAEAAVSTRYCIRGPHVAQADRGRTRCAVGDGPHEVIAYGLRDPRDHRDLCRG